MTSIAISRLHFPVTTLGPGRRLGIWLQGCSIRCPGCISVDTWPEGRGVTTVAQIMDALRGWIAEADGITISGGEPFDQPEGLRDLLRSLREQTPVSVLVYSGHPFERIAAWLQRNPDLVDGLMSEPFEASRSQTRALRGSDNQHLHLLTPLGVSALAVIDRPIDAQERTLDAMFDADGTVWFAGIPMRGDLAKLRAVLAEAGHDVSLTEGSV
ncbi:4Fe-4S single cluster domain-containing protein [Steroidobacter sp.]|uniref:4Fe-4S single cluster domain-containing protein n=1 Tax=Steroidobacter sp. TaxID=1978227 RepID=UPI001A6149FF|nr:4Fe-4S single cluster domain-containing protein [Steroidobacter sp.]MBL8271679.1 radical SAM protein [Steroidobacter sp.]